MLYYLYEMQRLWTAPVQLMAEGAKVALNNPFNPWSHTPAGRIASSAVDLVGHFTQRYGKPNWGIEATEIDDKTVPLTIETAIERTYAISSISAPIEAERPKIIDLCTAFGTLRDTRAGHHRGNVAGSRRLRHRLA